MSDARQQQLRTWLKTLADRDDFTLTPASSDASFRRYFRITFAGGATRIAMDAPPDKEDSRPFLRVTRQLEQAGLNVPHCHHQDLRQGFLLLDDLGEQQYLHCLDDSTADSLYADALDALLIMQKLDASGLPPYDAALLSREMELFREWFVGRHIGVELSASQHAVLDTTFKALTKAALEQPRVFVHRDYHSRNLMLTHDNNPGVLDYQDAVCGPLTYDLVSLFRDCYIAWPPSSIDARALDYRDRLVADGLLECVDGDTFLRWFDLMGAQRHLKAIGIFARLNYRDGKAHYFPDVPRTLNYIVEAAGRRAELRDLRALLRDLGIT